MIVKNSFIGQWYVPSDMDEWTVSILGSSILIISYILKMNREQSNCLLNVKQKEIYDGYAFKWVVCSPVARETCASIPGRVIPKTEKVVVDAALLNSVL